ncbi:hypothetical protein K661_00947 [Piscirickettsia salmonis LF-89 = ATCC VR-1361]|nr:hypothetical protein K661_00947 [Piscirickettsia salmonis LF-89 = ATCC VR-1361]
MLNYSVAIFALSHWFSLTYFWGPRGSCSPFPLALNSKRA